MEGLAARLDIDRSSPLSIDLTQRIHDARYSGKLSECAMCVLDLLVDHPEGPRAGREKALKIADMQRMWSRSGSHVWAERLVKDAVKQLLEVREIPIGSSRTSYAGFFLCVTDEDAEAAVKPYIRQIYSMFDRVKRLSPKSDFVRHLNGQMQLKEGAE